MKTNIQKTILIILLGFLSIGALIGGAVMIIAPSGKLVHMSSDYLTGTPFHNYLIPGIILFLLLGILPAITVYGLIAKSECKIMEALNVYKDKHWSTASSIYVGIILILWIDFQILYVGYNNMLQFIYAILGVLILIAALLPQNMKKQI